MHCYIFMYCEIHTLQWFLVHVFHSLPALFSPPCPPAGTDRRNTSSCCCFRGCRRRCRASLWQHFRCHRQNLGSERGTAPEGSHPWAFSVTDFQSGSPSNLYRVALKRKTKTVIGRSAPRSFISCPAEKQPVLRSGEGGQRSCVPLLCPTSVC